MAGTGGDSACGTFVRSCPLTKKNKKLLEVLTLLLKLNHLGLSLPLQRYDLLMSRLRRPLLAACERWMRRFARLRLPEQVQTAQRA